MSFFDFFILTSAGWRMSSLLANETGPFHVFLKIRKFAGQLEEHHPFWGAFHIRELVECELCNSVWIGIGLTLARLLFGKRIQWLVMPLALSTWIIQTKRLTERR